MKRSGTYLIEAILRASDLAIDQPCYLLPWLKVKFKKRKYFKKSQHSVSFTDSKVRTTRQQESTAQ